MNAYAESKGVIQRAATEIGSDGDRAGVPYDRPVYGNKSDLPQKRS
jgi:hypothetical protein